MLAPLTFFLVTSAFAADHMGMKANFSSATMKSLKGEVTLTHVKDGLRVQATVSGLKPNSRHGFHVHEKGECKGPDYTSAGDHFNPDKMMHGSPKSDMSHAGDLGNLVADSKGVAKLDEVFAHPSTIHLQHMVGKAVLIHAAEDDLKTQPSGDSGDRIACGIIKKI